MLTTNDTRLEEKAAHLAAEYLGGGRFTVASGSAAGAAYNVAAPTPGAHWLDWTCTCAWQAHGGQGCAHVRAARMKAEHLLARRGTRAAWAPVEAVA